MTALTLPPGVTEEYATRIAKHHWRNFKRQYPRDEARALEEFEEITTDMCCGDKASGERLATLAIWSPGP